MTTKFADLNIPDLATSLGITQSKVREIANTLLNEQATPTADLVTQVVQLYTSKGCDPILAAQEIAKNSKGNPNPDQPIDENEDSDLVQLLADQSYAAIAPLESLVLDMVTARFLIRVGTGFASGEAIKNPGTHTKSVLGVFKGVAKSAKLPNYNVKNLFAGVDSPLAIAPSVEQLD